MTLPTGAPVAWQQTAGTAGLFEVEWEGRAAAFAALGHPVAPGFFAPDSFGHSRNGGSLHRLNRWVRRGSCIITCGSCCRVAGPSKVAAVPSQAARPNGAFVGLPCCSGGMMALLVWIYRVRGVVLRV